jgi:hypothetical protein
MPVEQKPAHLRLPSFRLRRILKKATGENTTMLGTIMLAVLGETPRLPPALGLGAVISSDRLVFCDFVNRDGYLKTAAFVCDVEDLVNNFRGLADHLKLDDDDRIILFGELRKWIKKDWRASSNWDKLR